MDQTFLIQVDENDNQVGVVEKMKAHREGILHRAFSVFIFNQKGEWLLQQRAAGKYHSGGLWTNTCCGHPGDREQTIDAARARLKYEMGIDCELGRLLEFTYKASFKNGLVEHEYDHVYTGFCESVPLPNPGEVSDWKWISIEEVRKEVEAGEERYTAWFKLIFERVNSLIH